MNCKPGDLAYVVESGKKSHIGMVVKVERAGSMDRRYPTWVVSFGGVVIGNSDEVLVGQAECYDRSLRPISGVPVHEEQRDEVTA